MQDCSDSFADTLELPQSLANHFILFEMTGKILKNPAAHQELTH